MSRQPVLPPTRQRVYARSGRGGEVFVVCRIGVVVLFPTTQRGRGGRWDVKFLFCGGPSILGQSRIRLFTCSDIGNSGYRGLAFCWLVGTSSLSLESERRASARPAVGRRQAIFALHGKPDWKSSKGENMSRSLPRRSITRSSLFSTCVLSSATCVRGERFAERTEPGLLHVAVCRWSCRVVGQCPRSTCL